MVKEKQLLIFQRKSKANRGGNFGTMAQKSYFHFKRRNAINQ